MSPPTAPARVDLRGIALVFVAIATLQVGAAFAVTLFDELGPAGASLLRLGIAALVLIAWWRPRLRGHAPADLAVTLAFGLTLGTMNLAIYEAMNRIPPYSLELESLRRIPARVFGVLMSLEPAVAVLAGFVVLGQALGALDLLAIALVVAASAGVTAARPV